MQSAMSQSSPKTPSLKRFGADNAGPMGLLESINGPLQDLWLTSSCLYTALLQEIYKKLQLSRVATKISGYTRLAEPSANRSLQKSSLCDFLESGPRSPALDATRPNLVNHHPTRHQKAEAGASRFLIPRLRGFPLSFSILDPGTFTKSHRFPYSMARNPRCAISWNLALEVRRSTPRDPTS